MKQQPSLIWAKSILNSLTCAVQDVKWEGGRGVTSPKHLCVCKGVPREPSWDGGWVGGRVWAPGCTEGHPGVKDK